MIHPVFTARDILAMSREEVKSIPIVHSIVFDDGDRLDNVLANETIYSHIFWDIFRPPEYIRTRILKKHHLVSVLKGEELNTDSHTKLCSNMLRSIVEECGLRLPEQKEPLLALIYQTISLAMSELSILTEESVTSIDILDFLQIAKNEKIEGFKKEAFEDPRRIKYAYEKSMELIEHDPEFQENGLAKAVKAKMVKANQVAQCVVFRGYPSEVDGAIFPVPIWSNYTLGNTRLYDFVTDSRTAAKSHFYAETSLRDSEYMARRFRLFSTVVERIVYEDCGSTQYFRWKVKGPKKDSSGTTIYPGDLEFLIGKIYIDEETGQHKVIEGNEKHLIDKEIQFRSVIYCKTPDPHAVCNICAGRVTENFSRFANVGHLGHITSTKPLTQSILSIKHVNTSSVSVKMHLGHEELQYLNTGASGGNLYLNDSLSNYSVKIVVARDEAPGLIDLTHTSNVEGISLTRISEITQIMLILERKDKPQHKKSIPILVEQRGKPVLFTSAFVKYISRKGWTIDESNNFAFDMEGWNYKDPIIGMPNREESYVDLANQASVLVESSFREIAKRHERAAPAILVMELFDLINSKLKVNILSFEIMVYALMVESKSSFALSRGSSEAVLGVAEALTRYRSLGAGLAFENQGELLTEPISFFKGKRPDSPLDVFFAPQQVVAAYKNKR